jgi:hypothetical protein
MSDYVEIHAAEFFRDEYQALNPVEPGLFDMDLD